MLYQVNLDTVEKQLRKAPKEIVRKLLAWATAVEADGLGEVRKIPGYHDEALHGQRAGQRSIRLSLKWRAIYEEHETREVVLVEVQEVTAHDYRTKK